MGEEKLLFFNTGKVEPEPVKYIIQSDLSKKGLNLANRYNNKIVALLLAYNEEVSIGSIVLRSREHTDRVIVIDDGSNDYTSRIAKMAGVEVIRHIVNMGKGEALKTGFDAAL